MHYLLCIVIASDSVLRLRFSMFADTVRVFVLLLLLLLLLINVKIGVLQQSLRRVI